MVGGERTLICSFYDFVVRLFFDIQAFELNIYEEEPFKF